ncbi:MAG TPA: VOC family protein [Streptosporangiaceae bacterium]|jgi:catechol 2,3-dioxygenase-like lactoylglutathione lyase family enzyme
MQAVSVTIGIPVRDLARSRAWYDRLLAKEAPELEPAPGIVEYHVGGVWVQLMGGEPPGGSWTPRFGVADLDSERRRLEGLLIELGDVRTVPGASPSAISCSPTRTATC